MLAKAARDGSQSTQKRCEHWPTVTAKNAAYNYRLYRDSSKWRFLLL